MRAWPPTAEEAIGVECAWPVRKVATAQRRVVRQGRVTLHKHARRAIAVAIVVSALTASGWSVKDSAIEIATFLPGGVPAQSE